LTDPASSPPHSTGAARVQQSADGLELYFPPLRSIEAPLALAAFGLIASIVPALAGAALLPHALADAAGRIAAVFLAGVIVPFMLFGMAFVGLAAYMLANSLTVTVNQRTITTARTLLGVTVRRDALPTAAISRIDSEIATREQSLLRSEPVYRLVAVDARGKRLVVAEALRGTAEMEAVRGMIESTIRR
jgi:hypothetical protein